MGLRYKIITARLCWANGAPTLLSFYPARSLHSERTLASYLYASHMQVERSFPIYLHEAEGQEEWTPSWPSSVCSLTKISMRALRTGSQVRMNERARNTREGNLSKNSEFQKRIYIILNPTQYWVDSGSLVQFHSPEISSFQVDKSLINSFLKY